MSGKRTLADWIWTVVGVAGIGCIGIAVFLLLSAKSPEEQTEQRFGQAEDLWKTGKAKLDEGDAAGAVADLETALQLIEGRHPGLQNDFGEALQAAGRGADAQANWLAAIRLHPVYARPYLNLARWWDSQGSQGPALQFYRAALALHAEPLPDDLLPRVLELQRELAGKREDELVEFRERYRANPADTEAFCVLLLVELDTTQVAEDAKPADGLRAALLSVGRKFEDLAALHERQIGAVKDRERSVVDRAGLGTILLLLGRFEEAGETFTTALELSAGDATSQLGAALADVVNGAPDDSRVAAARERLVGNPVSWLAFGAACLEQGKAEPACQALFQALRRNPALPEVYRLLALAYGSLEEVETSEADREAALRAYRRLFE